MWSYYLHDKNFLKNSSCMVKILPVLWIQKSCSLPHIPPWHTSAGSFLPFGKGKNSLFFKKRIIFPMPKLHRALEVITSLRREHCHLHSPPLRYPVVPKNQRKGFVAHEQDTEPVSLPPGRRQKLHISRSNHPWKGGQVGHPGDLSPVHPGSGWNHCIFPWSG